jgi:hypothetical protein
MYTCPMHPEVRQDHPGACSKCGMAEESIVSVLRDLALADDSRGGDELQLGLRDRQFAQAEKSETIESENHARRVPS